MPHSFNKCIRVPKYMYSLLYLSSAPFGVIFETRYALRVFDANSTILADAGNLGFSDPHSTARLYH